MLMSLALYNKEGFCMPSGRHQVLWPPDHCHVSFQLDRRVKDDVTLLIRFFPFLFCGRKWIFNPKRNTRWCAHNSNRSVSSLTICPSATLVFTRKSIFRLTVAYFGLMSSPNFHLLQYPFLFQETARLIYSFCLNSNTHSMTHLARLSSIFKTIYFQPLSIDFGCHLITSFTQERKRIWRIAKDRLENNELKDHSDEE